MQMIPVSLDALFVPSGGTVDDTPVFLLNPTVCRLILFCSNYKIDLKIDGVDQSDQLLEVKVIQINSSVEIFDHLIVPLTSPSYPTEALPPVRQNQPPIATTFLEEISVNHNLEPTFRLKEGVEDFYFELECGYAIDILYVEDFVLTVSIMNPYNAETEMTELAAQISVDLQQFMCQRRR